MTSQGRIALAQLERMGGPTVIVPVLEEVAQSGVFDAPYCRDHAWLEMAQGGSPRVCIADGSPPTTSASDRHEARVRRRFSDHDSSDL